MMMTVLMIILISDISHLSLIGRTGVNLSKVPQVISNSIPLYDKLVYQNTEQNMTILITQLRSIGKSKKKKNNNNNTISFSFLGELKRKKKLCYYYFVKVQGAIVVTLKSASA